MAEINTQSRFAGLDRRWAMLVIAVLVLAIAACFIPAKQAAPVVSAHTAAPAKPKVANEDLLLYQKINARVGAGEEYYAVASDELRKGNYPLKPFVTFRQPTLAHIMGTLGPSLSFALLCLLTAATLFAWWRRLDGAFDDPGRRITGVMLVGAGAALVAQPQYAVMHELWAGLLMALALALRKQVHWGWVLAVAAIALFVRELALPFVLLFAAAALFEKNWRELAGWSALLITFAFLFYLHATHVAAAVRPEDPSSPGWLSIGGWHGFLQTMRLTSAIRVLPDALGNMLVILSIFGWLSWRTSTGLVGSLFLLGYGLIFMVLGRPDNFYWGLLVAPVLLLGLAFLPRAFGDLRASFAPIKAN